MSYTFTNLDRIIVRLVFFNYIHDKTVSFVFPTFRRAKIALFYRRDIIQKIFLGNFYGINEFPNIDIITLCDGLAEVPMEIFHFIGAEKFDFLASVVF